MTTRGRTVALGFAVSLLLAASARAQGPGELEDSPPRYEVELIIFSYADVDSNEELFDHGRRPAQLPEGLPEWRQPSADALGLGLAGRETLEGGENHPAPDAAGRADEPGDDLGGADEELQERRAPLLAIPSANGRLFRFRPLGPDELRLGSELQTLTRLGAYRPLFHGGWVQEGLTEHEAQPFDLALLGAVNPRGSIRLHVSRFPHVTVDLSYQAPGAAIGEPRADRFGLSEIAIVSRYSMRQQRRVPSGELHYFDHPAFGVLLEVREVEDTDEPAGAGPKPAA